MSRPNTIRYQPALDGLRALAVAAVLLFHAGLGWMSGGYLGVSVFFTLSGFLITSLLLTESKATGSVDARSFYTRRARRLLPASVVCVSAVSVLAAANMFKGAAHVRRDVLGALFQVFNWVKLGSGESYADLNSAIAGVRQPLDHYWSLAIEEQFYWLWPLTFLVLLWWRRRRPAFSIGLAVTGLFLMAAVAAPLIAVQWGPDAAYWATPARASEILAGAVVACWLVQGHRGLTLDRPVAAPSDPAAGRRGLMPGWLSWLAPLCLLALAAACVLFPDGSGPAYDGALPLVGVTSAGLILGLQVAGPVRRLLSIKPLVAIGKVSYGVYLYHWPIYVLVDRQQWDVPVGVSLLIKVVITAVVTVVSYFLIERPIRRAEWLVPRRTLIGALTLTAAAAALVLVVPVAGKFYSVDAAAAQQAALGTDSVAPLIVATSAIAPPSMGSTTAAMGPATAGPTSQPGSVPASGQTSAPTLTTEAAPATSMPVTGPVTGPVPVPSRPVRILVVGDSTAEATGGGLVAWAAANPSLARVSLEVREGCGFVPGGFIPYGPADRDVKKACGQWLPAQITAAVRKLHPDVVMLMTTSWDAVDRRLTRTGPVLPITDPAVRPVITAALDSITKQVLEAGATKVLWVREPIPNPLWMHLVGGQRDPANHEVLYDEMAALALVNPDVRVADLAGWIDARSLQADTVARPDGVHWSPETARRIADEFLGPELIRAALT